MPDASATIDVAVAQIASERGDIAANLRKHLDVIDAARDAGVAVLVFPELSLTGHSAGPDTLRLALRGDAACIAQIASASGPMCTVFGLVEEGDGARLFNSAIAVRDGATVAVHRKINLATYGRLEDGKHFGAGRRVGTFDVGAGWRASMLICADLWNPPLVHLAALQDITLLLAPVSSAIEAVGADFDNPGGWSVNLQFHAQTYGLPIAMANRIGGEDGLTFWGGSRIVDAFGRTVAQAQGAEEALVHGTVAFADVRRARYQLPTVRDANTPLIASELARVAGAAT